MQQEPRETVGHRLPASAPGQPPTTSPAPAPFPQRTSPFPGAEIEEGYIELIADTLQQLDPPLQGAFLRSLLKGLASVDISEENSLTYWQEILRRRRELSDRFGRAVTLRIAAVDYFGSAGILRNPILLEYEEFKRLHHSAATDPLTGFYNRRLFEDYLARELNRASRYSAPFALLLIDLRSFKKANDTYGHSIGDEILRSVGRACNETIRGSDYAFRIGGDEFALLLPQSDNRSAEALAGRIAQKFEEYAKPLAPRAPIGLDYGIASFPTEAADRSSLFEAADRNLYTNKKRAYEQLGESAPEVTQPRMRAGEAGPGQPEGEAPTIAPATPSPGEQRPTTPATMFGGESKERIRRRHERSPLVGSGSLGLVRVGLWPELVRVLDISPGGVALLMEESVQVPEKFEARLNAPKFPLSELMLRRVYSLQAAEGKKRVGCSFDA